MKWPRSGFKLFRYRQYCKHKSRFILFYCYKKCQKVWILNRKSWPSWLLSQSLEWGTAKVKDVQKKDLPFKVKKNLLYSMLIPLALAASASFPRNPNEPMIASTTHWVVASLQITFHNSPFIITSTIQPCSICIVLHTPRCSSRANAGGGAICPELDISCRHIV